MPWIVVGRHTFELTDVAVLTEGVEVEGDRDGITISLRSGYKVDLVGEDARLFTEAFTEFSGARSISRPPAEVKTGARLVPPRPEGNSHGPSRESNTAAHG